MKKVCTIAFVISVLFASCARGISPYEAANGKAKCAVILTGNFRSTIVKQIAN